jgi:hypothetical protein
MKILGKPILDFLSFCKVLGTAMMLLGIFWNNIFKRVSSLFLQKEKYSLNPAGR